MKLTEAINYYKTLLQRTNKKSELKLYQGFIDVLSNLSSRDLSEKQLRSIEQMLGDLNIKVETSNRKRHTQQQYAKFTRFLKKEFSFVTEGYYNQLGLVLGLTFGSAIGTALGAAFGDGTTIAIGVAMGPGIGMVFGLMYGAAKDAEAKKQNLVLK